MKFEIRCRMSAQLLSRAAALAVALAFGLAPGVRAATYAVGSGCPHTTIATAVLAAWLTPEDDLIKITQDLTNQSVVLDDFKISVRGKVTIRGGYTSCADTTASGRSTIDGIASNPLVTVETSSQTSSVVVLENLVLEGSGVRGIEVTAGGHLTLDNVMVQDNLGGGVRVGSNGTLATDASSAIEHNGWGGAFPPATGGGILCESGHLDLRGLVYNNRAELGGGIAMYSGCSAELRPGLWIEGNQALSNGGGLYLVGGSVVLGNGNGTPIVFWNNSGERGGGLYAAGATAVLQDAWFTANLADLQGGAIHASGGAVVNVSAAAGCADAPLQSCNRIELNLLTTNGEGSAVYANGAEVTLRRQRLDRNQNEPGIVAEMQPSLLYVTGASGLLTLENLQLWNNRAVEIVAVAGGASAVGGYLSSARNSYVYPGGIAPSVIQVSGTGTDAAFYSSIFWDHQGFFLAGPSPSLLVDCLIVNTAHGVPAGSLFIRTDNPQFLGADAGNLHLASSSPAVDFCDEAVYPFPGAPDVDGQARGIDHPANPNGSPGFSGGTFDIGFDEVPSGILADIFRDDFDAGNTAAWALTAP